MEQKDTKERNSLIIAQSITHCSGQELVKRLVTLEPQNRQFLIVYEKEEFAHCLLCSPDIDTLEKCLKYVNKLMHSHVFGEYYAILERDTTNQLLGWGNGVLPVTLVTKEGVKYYENKTNR